MVKPVKRYLEVGDYPENGLRPLYESLVSPIEQFSPAEAIKQKQIQASYDRYARWNSDHLNNMFEIPWWGNLWEKNPYEACKVILGPQITAKEARLGAEKISPYLIELLESDPTPLNRTSIQLWLTALKTSSRVEKNFHDFSDHVLLELGIFESSALDTDLKSYLVHIEPFQNLRRYSYQLGDGMRKYSYEVDGKGSTSLSPWSQEDMELEREFYKVLGLESQSDVGRFHTVLFRRDFFEALLVPIDNFAVDKK